MADKKNDKKPAAKKPAAKRAPEAKAKAGAKAAAGKTGKSDAGKSKSKAAAAAERAEARPARAERPPRPRKPAPAADDRPAPLGVHDLRPASGATHYRKRVGRGPGSGHGKTAGRGYKGQKSRTGYSHMRGFEGGQMPLHRRVPKRGFTNIFRVEYDIVNLSDLARFDAGQAVTLEALAQARLARKNRPVKILGDGEIGKALTVSAHKFSANARGKIEAAGGKCEVIER